MKQLLFGVILCVAFLSGKCQQNFFHYDDGKDWSIRGGLITEDTVLLFGGISAEGRSNYVANLNAGILAFNLQENQFFQLDFYFPPSLAVIDFLSSNSSGYIGFGRTRPDSLGFSNLMIFKLNNSFNVIFQKTIELPRARQFICHDIQVLEWENNFFVAFSESENSNSGWPVYRNFYCAISPNGEILKKRITPTYSPQSTISTACISPSSVPYISLINVNGKETIFELDSNFNLVPFFEFSNINSTIDTDGIYWLFARGSFISNNQFHIGIRKKIIQTSPAKTTDLYSAISISMDDTSQWNGPVFGDTLEQNVLYNFERNPYRNQNIIVGLNGKYPAYNIGPDPSTIMIDVINNSDSTIQSYELDEYGEIISSDICFNDTSIFILGRYYSDDDEKYYSPALIRIDNGKLIQSFNKINFEKAEINIYPNPVHSGHILSIKGVLLKENYSINVVDQQGRVYKCEYRNQSQIDIPKISTGIYSMIITYPDGVLQKKIIIQ